MKSFALLPAVLLMLSCSGGNNDTPAKNKQPIAVNQDITVEQLHDVIASGKDIYLMDVRTAPEYTDFHVAEVDMLLPYDSIQYVPERLPQDKSAELFVICRTGRRSGIAVDELREMGYRNVHNIEGGTLAWRSAGYNVVSGK